MSFYELLRIRSTVSHFTAETDAGSHLRRRCGIDTVGNDFRGSGVGVGSQAALEAVPRACSSTARTARPTTAKYDQAEEVVRKLIP